MCDHQLVVRGETGRLLGAEALVRVEVAGAHAVEAQALALGGVAAARRAGLKQGGRSARREALFIKNFPPRGPRPGEREAWLWREEEEGGRGGGAPAALGELLVDRAVQADL